MYSKRLKCHCEMYIILVLQNETHGSTLITGFASMFNVQCSMFNVQTFNVQPLIPCQKNILPGTYPWNIGVLSGSCHFVDLVASN